MRQPSARVGGEAAVDPADVETMSDPECREQLTLMLSALKAEVLTLIWLRRAALHVVDGSPGQEPPAQATSNTAIDMPGMEIFKILKTPPPIDLLSPGKIAGAQGDTLGGLDSCHWDARPRRTAS
jgi:hypothetical protein